MFKIENKFVFQKKKEILLLMRKEKCKESRNHHFQSFVLGDTDFYNIHEDYM